MIRFVDRALMPDLAETVRASVAAHEFPLPDGTLLRRTCSIGCATWPFSRSSPREVDWERVIDVADGALYTAKRSGRDAWVAVSCGEGDAVAADESFRADAASALAAGAVTIRASSRVGAMLVWENERVASGRFISSEFD